MTAENVACCTGSSITLEGPQTEKEETLAVLWSRVLELGDTSIGRHDHFFRRGGDSITAMKLVAAAEEIGILLTFGDIFSHPALSAQAELVSSRTGEQSNYNDNWFESIVGEVRKREIVELSAKECALSESQIEDIYPSTPMQQGLITLSIVRPGTYISQRVYQLPDDVSIPILELAWRATFEANPLLRTRIVQGPDGEAFQVVVREKFNFSIHYDLEEYLRQDKARPMELGQPLARLAVIHSSSESPSRCVLTLHHCIYDAWSVSLLLEQVDLAYHGNSLAAWPFSPFVSYIWQSTSEAEKYWKAEFLGFEGEQFPSLPYPTYTPTANESEHTDVKILSNGTNVTLSNSIRLAWALTVARYTGSDDVVFGLTVSGRGAPVPGIDKMAGPTIATFPLRVQLRPNVSLQEELLLLQEQLISALPFEQYGLQHIGQLGDDAARACRFQTLLVIQQVPLHQKSSILGDFADVNARPVWDTYGLTLLCTPSSNGYVHVEAVYDAKVIPKAQLRRTLNLFAQILTQVTQSANRLVGDVNSISPEDLQQLQTWNSHVPQLSSMFIHELIRDNCVSQAKATAIDAWDGEFTYGELENLSSRLALSLTEHGIRPDVFVPLCFEKSKWVAVAMLAVAKAGGAFILLDPSYPVQRLQGICGDCQATVLLCSLAQVDLAGQLGCSHILPIGGQNIKHVADSSICRDHHSTVVQPSHALYAVYTSGSTGKPKGIIIEHGALATNATITGPNLLLNKHSRVFQFSSHAFDATIADYLFTLACWGCVCVPDEAASRGDVAHAMNEFKVNWVFLTPSVARTLGPRAVPTLEVLAMGGEPAKPLDFAIWAGHVQVLHMYGPSECTIYSTMQPTVHKSSSPTNIGHGLAVACWLVNPKHPDQLVPIGSIGELLIEGPPVGRGYIGNETQTRSSFIACPKWLSPLRLGQYARLYRTGDLARYSPTNDGSLEFVGRKDHQVKIRGQRIELAEIEYQVTQTLPEATDIMVEIITPSDMDTHTLLVAFIWDAARQPMAKPGIEAELSPLSVPDEQFKAKTTHAEMALRKVLPRHMVPTLFIPLRYLPLSPNGKANRRFIREKACLLSRRELNIYRNSESQAKRPPSNEVEKKLQQLIVDILHISIEEVGIDDQFSQLSMLGLDSIQLMRLVALIRKVFEVHIAVGTLYDTKLTVTGLAAMISTLQMGDKEAGNVPTIDISTEITGAYDQLIQRYESLHRRRKVFLTGSTGFLGSQILRQLLRDPCVEKVILHVRAASAAKGLERIASIATMAQWWSPSYLDRITCWTGDLSAPRLGLQPEQWRILCGMDAQEQVHSIIHNGATVQWQAPYHIHKPANVDSTIELLAALRLWNQAGTFTFVTGGRQRSVDQDLGGFMQTLQTANGYSQSKFLAEQLVSMFASRQSTHHISVVRPGRIVGTETEGIPNADDFLWKLVQICLQMGKYPGNDGHLWITVADVEEVATGILRITFGVANEDVAPSILNIETGITVSHFWDIVQDTLQTKLVPMKTEDWKQAAELFLEAAEESHAFRPLLAMLQESQLSFGGKKPDNAGNISPGIIKANIETLVDVGFLSTVQCPGSKKVGRSTVFSRS
ncbi:hypothetical protein BDV38DRAFT_289327 [Aspergillus pseudotamarii]|uniref:Carrier domain-containing protein n=1 Tax=Aspergillus pseudotamarii TaxID=132259 RepID=A0A5N6SA93_ASPPS|nr:uncharacterized protein BDV38DRAFT_289327 [Aspergillus pseudotamarii]KAE8130779.1 hypothetical protein BDV38DRAFT_289327 [Aspergillus pseudotamarii]